MYVLLTRFLGTLLAGLTFAVAKIAQRCGVIADWCLRKLTWLLNELQEWLKRAVILTIDWSDHAIMRVLRTLWLLESAFARSAARCLHLCYLFVMLGLFYAPTVACVVVYWWFGSVAWLAVGVCWGVLITSLLVSFLFSPQKNAATIELPNLRWLERIFRYAFRLGPLFTIAIYCYSFQATPLIILIGVGWLGAAIVFARLTNAPDPQFVSLTEFIAAVTHSRAIKLDPKSASEYFKRGVGYLRQGELSEAVSDLGKSIDLNPKNGWAYCERGVAHRLQDKLSEAIADQNQAIDLYPKYASAYYERGVAYHRQGKLSEAIADLSQAIKLDPKDIRYHVTLAGFLRTLHRDSESARLIETARELMGTTDEYNRACFESVCGNTDAALRFLTVAIETNLISLHHVLHDPDLIFIRDDPQFRALVRRAAGVVVPATEDGHSCPSGSNP